MGCLSTNLSIILEKTVAVNLSTRSKGCWSRSLSWLLSDRCISVDLSSVISQHLHLSMTATLTLHFSMVDTSEVWTKALTSAGEGEMKYVFRWICPFKSDCNSNQSVVKTHFLCSLSEHVGGWECQDSRFRLYLHKPLTVTDWWWHELFI